MRFLTVLIFSCIVTACGGDRITVPLDDLADVEPTDTAVGDDGDATGVPDTDTSDPVDTTAPTDTGVDDTGQDTSGDASRPEPGEFGAPCGGNIDCFSGLCIDSDLGPVCTRTCVEECPGGWSCRGVSSGTDVVFVCVPQTDRLCSPCTVDNQCGTGYCLTFEDGRRCSAACKNDGDCPDGYVCEDTTTEGVSGASSLQCVPVNNDCSCLPGQEGLERPCNNQNPAGTCWGNQTCGGIEGWSACDARTPEAELCDGADNNCNNFADENLVDETPCTNENDFGTCTGQRFCDGANGWSCRAQTPAAETCNYIDDDCSGVVDDLFRNVDTGLYDRDEHCGVCGNDCAGFFPNAISACAVVGGQARCVVAGCAPGYYQAGPSTCLPVVAANCLPCTQDANCVVPGNACVALDGGNFCAESCGVGNLNGLPAGTCADGFTCENVGGRDVCVPATGSCACLSSEDDGKTRPCTESNGFGTCGGQQLCNAASGGFSACSARVPGAEICNGLDDDCDGQVDEGVIEPTEACRNTNDAGTCNGAWRCGGDDGWLCTAATPATETCNGQDDDCDGTADEDFIDAASGRYAVDDHCGLCNRKCDDAVLFSTATECRVEDGVSVCVATACEEGFIVPPETNRVCIPVSGGTDCSPCADDTQCNGLPGGACTEVDGGRFCTRGCANTAECGDGYTCEEGRCLPVSRSCTCLANNVGAMRPCVRQNNSGTCGGVETCAPATGWGACSALTPSAEACNGIDDNCNGRIDENVAHTPATCAATTAAGTCTGTYRCEGESGWQCPVQTPETETCNFQDDNCDGRVDEAFRNAAGKYVADQHCGVCGNSCEGLLPNATARCAENNGNPRCEVATCDPGYYQVSPLTCLPAVTTTCAPCVTDANCPTPGDLCLDIDGGRFCGRDCSANNVHGLPAGQCDPGYTCLDVGGAEQCVPVSGSCSCLEENDGDLRSCNNRNENGICAGTELCVAGFGWGGCTADTPDAETCNGIDDDCDGQTDEGVSVPTAPCATTNGFGTCGGSWSCAGVDGWSCNARAPAAETCNGLDDDCDAQTDEDFRDAAGVFTHDAHCGACGLSCEGALPNATAECVRSGTTARCEVDTCAPGFYRANALTCLPASDSRCLACFTDANCPTPGDRCLELDGGRFCGRDCSTNNLHGLAAGQCGNGYTCTAVAGGPDQCVPTSGSCTCLPDDNGDTRACNIRNAEGTCAGTQTCNAASGWTTCSARTPAAEACNGQDDNCNGFVDEGVSHSPTTCANTIAGVGTCSANWVCGGASGWSCNAATPTTEACDFDDDDCDGQVDENFRDTSGRYIADDHCGSCGISCTGAIPNASARCGLSPTGTPRCEVESCDTGFYQAGPLACVAVTDNLCVPCTSDSDCRTPGDRCVTVDGASFCGQACDANNLHDNPVGGCNADGFVCTAFAGGPDQCIPASGTCSCLPQNDGARRPCSRANANGTCFGEETCDADAGWVGCSARTPAAEICNGVDDDCDAFIDEGVAHDPATCANTVAGVGTCSAAWTCGGTSGWQCAAATPAAESCNGKDDNCNGQTDESFRNASGIYLNDQHCGACGVSCVGAIPNATATCRVAGTSARCEVATCATGFYQAGPLTCLPAVDNSCAPCVSDSNCGTPGDRCLSLDGAQVCGRDCAAGNVHGTAAGTCPNGFTCNDLGGGVRQCVPVSGSCSCLTGDAGDTRACVAENAAGSCLGVAVCDPATGWGSCSARVPATETCNTIDDNCDAVVDNVPGRGDACVNSNGFGSCPGVRDCASGAALVCVGRTPASDVCNYIDDDCDGQTDEGYTDLNTSCSAGLGACLRFGFKVCSANGSNTVCNAVAGPQATEICDSIDNDCNGQTDENAAWNTKGQPCTLGQGVCQVTGVNVCNASGSGLVCSQQPPTPAVSTEAGLCNGLDDDCDGSPDEDFALKGQVCMVGQGVCRNFGNYVCSANGAGVECNATPGTGGTETCDLLDNDCDGQVDEDFRNASGKYDRDTQCGNCFTDCTAIFDKPNAFGTCDASPATPTCRLGCDPGYFDLNGVPDDGCEFYLDPTAIYVSASGTGAVDNSGCGLGPAATGGGRYPCRTISYGLGRAVALGSGRTRVLVADGLYTETVTLVAGKDLLGGHRADTWERNVAATNTTIRGPSVTVGHAKTIIASGITTATLFEGFVVYGGTTFAAGANSYAFWIRNSNGQLTIRDNLVFGGNAGAGGSDSNGSGGGDGTHGQPGERSVLTTSHNDCSAQANVPGNVADCFDANGNLVPGACGNGGANTCGGSSVAGGSGAGAICPSGNTQQGSGAVGGSVTGGGAAGSGGAGGHDRQSGNCTSFGTGGFSATGQPGTDGGRGVDETSGVGCSGTGGSVDNNGEWVPAAAGSGVAGKPGGGGGGGGAGGGADVTSNCNDNGDQTDDSLGGSGGGGGAGGCGGGGGGGGVSGGRSFVFFISNSSSSNQRPTLIGNILTRGNGGDGGSGGIGGKGGRGGDGGLGGNVFGRFGYAMGPGGRGGQGGDGGHGGGGGGGCGGHVYTVFVHNVSGTPDYHVPANGNIFVDSGAGGAGGIGGASPGNAGGNGQSGQVFDYNY
jgi:hypothetical protein